MAATAVDLADVSGRFGAALHAAGVPVDPAASGRFAAALAAARPQRTAELYWLARVTLVSDRAQLAVFDAVFGQIFGGLADAAGADRNTDAPGGVRPPARPGPQTEDRHGRTGGGALGKSAGERPGGEDSAAVPLATASADELLRHRTFDTCTAAELERLRQLIGDLLVDPPQRRSRRTRRAATGRTLDRRATLAAARRTGGDPVRIVRRRRRTRERRIVLLADVSGSMEAYGRAYLYLLHGAVRAVRAEAFVFATRLHRLTRQLRAGQPAVALAAAMAAAPDWSGGTRLGEALQAFNDGWARRGLARGAVVVIVSDGWESGDVALLGREMERLARLAHRIVWVNPRKQSAGYQPLAGGMAAALPHVDAFVSGHSLDAFDEVIAAIHGH